MNPTKNNGYELLEFINVKEEEMNFYIPISGSYAVLNCSEKYLMCYNARREQWELPAGKREWNEIEKLQPFVKNSETSEIKLWGEE